MHGEGRPAALPPLFQKRLFSALDNGDAHAFEVRIRATLARRGPAQRVAVGTCAGQTHSATSEMRGG